MWKAHMEPRGPRRSMALGGAAGGRRGGGGGAPGRASAPGEAGEVVTGHYPPRSYSFIKYSK